MESHVPWITGIGMGRACMYIHVVGFGPTAKSLDHHEVTRAPATVLTQEDSITCKEVRQQEH